MARTTQREGTDVRGRDCYETSSSSWAGGKGSIRIDEQVKESYSKNYDKIDWSIKLTTKLDPQKTRETTKQD